jgi:hypothetical protein
MITALKFDLSLMEDSESLLRPLFQQAGFEPLLPAFLSGKVVVTIPGAPECHWLTEAQVKTVQWPSDLV